MARYYYTLDNMFCVDVKEGEDPFAVILKACREELAHLADEDAYPMRLTIRIGEVDEGE